jgi:hypothetical protein
MYRYGIRFFVALLTFAIGLLISAVPNLFHRSPLVSVRARHSSCHRKIGYFPSPVMSIGTQPNEPLKILYLSTSLDPDDPNKRQVDFLVESRSDREIKGFTINYRLTSNTKGGGGGVSVVANPQEQVFKTGDSQVVRINCDADQVLTLWLNSAEFADGSHWNNEQEFKWEP